MHYGFTSLLIFLVNFEYPLDLPIRGHVVIVLYLSPEAVFTPSPNFSLRPVGEGSNTPEARFLAWWERNDRRTADSPFQMLNMTGESFLVLQGNGNDCRTADCPFSGRICRKKAFWHRGEREAITKQLIFSEALRGWMKACQRCGERETSFRAILGKRLYSVWANLWFYLPTRVTFT
jgi:hypothetical protein